MISIEIDKMSSQEKIEAMEPLWDSLLHEKEKIDSPSWHKDILTERKQKIESGKAKFISIDDFKKKSVT